MEKSKEVIVMRLREKAVIARMLKPAREESAS
jgi:hypothetical protein